MDKYIAAAFSYLAYNPTKTVNDVVLPNSWTLDDSLSNLSGSNANEWSGFGAHVYLEGDPTSPSQVVIAFRWTEDGGAAVMDWLNNFALASGFPAPQLTAAIDRYLEVRKKYPDAKA